MSDAKKDVLLDNPRAVPDKANELADAQNNMMGFSGAQKIELPRGTEKEEREDGSEIDAKAIEGVKSVLNDYHLFRYNQGNYPIFEKDQPDYAQLYKNITVDELVSKPRGASIYKSADFMYMKDLGIPLNHLITLRRFPFATFDDIFSSNQTEPDLARMLTFFDPSVNALNEITKFTYGVRWKPLTAEYDQASMHGTEDGSGVEGFMKNILKFVDPKFGKEAAMGEGRLTLNPKFDQNRVYGPVDSINETHIRDIGIDFTFDITVKFEYSLKSINGMNSKMVMMDILSNVLACTYINAKFWGGARYWIGPRPTKFLKDIKFMAPNDWEDFLSQGRVKMKELFGKNNMTRESAIDMLKNVANNALNLNLGKFLDKAGRPGIVTMNSLLTGAPVGEWHLTIGNPMNPILTIGDLMLIESTIEFGGDELGYDDFPEQLIVTCVLKPAKPRDIAGIESMYNSGQGRIYWKPQSLNATGVTNSPNSNFGSHFGGFVNSAIERAATKVYDFAQKGATKVKTVANTQLASAYYDPANTTNANIQRRSSEQTQSDLNQNPVS